MQNDGMVETVDRQAELGRAGFYEKASAENLAPLWRVLHGLVTEKPRSAAVPALWRYEKVRPYLMEACELISTGESQRRVLVLENPALRGQSRITPSLFAGLQIIRPGEVAPSHRHVASALRFIIEGRDAYTTVSGERTVMAPGDFVITPSWCWHDHGNESDMPMIWLDGLDMHMVNLFSASFREDYPQSSPPLTRPESGRLGEVGTNLVPDNFKLASQNSPIFSYPYSATRDALDRLSRQQPPDVCHGHRMRYINPLTSSSAMPTLTTAMQLLPKGFRSEPYRSTAGTIFSVVEGTGSVEVMGQRFDWGPRDLFVIPSWHSFELDASSEAVIFSYSDQVVQEKLEFFREQRGNADARSAK